MNAAESGGTVERQPRSEVWRGVAQLECTVIRELSLRSGETCPVSLFCYQHGEMDRIVRLAEWGEHWLRADG